MPFLAGNYWLAIQPDGSYKTIDELRYQGKDEVFVVPPDFPTDLASSPRFLTALVPVSGLHTRAAILHDYLCERLNAWHRRGDSVPPPPASAVDTDGIFRRTMRELEVSLVLRWLAWTGVRWGALANPARREGWFRPRNMLPVLGISLLALPFVAPVALFTGLALGVGKLVDLVAK